MSKLVKNYNKATNNFADTVTAIESLPLSGELAREQAAKELDDAYSNLVGSAEKIRNYIKNKYLEGNL